MSLSLHTDLYQINMAYAYFKDNIHYRRSVFELYFRKTPFENGYAVFAGLQRIVEVLDEFKFTNEDIDYLRKYEYSEDFLTYLSNFKFTGNIRCVEEGEIVFANEPLLIVEANLIEAQLIETILLNIVNYQTLIATKASRIRQLVKDKPLLEFGARRAQELDAAVWGARAAYISGFNGTSLVSAGKKFDIPVFGTHSHSFVQAYQDEYNAFLKYASVHKDVVFLIDTYDTLKSGIINAIKVAKLLGDKINFIGVRIDSGDLAYHSKKVREILDENGYNDVLIIASNDLDEYTIASLILEGAKIDMYGIGTKLITSYSQPALGAVYKLVKIDDTDVIKISNNLDKITTPGNKIVYRIINSQNKCEGDLITLVDEDINFNLPIKLFSEINPLINKVVDNYTAINIHKQIFKDGNLVYKLPSITMIRDYHQNSINLMWEEHLRMNNPATYYVDLSLGCFENKQKLISKYK